MLKAAKDLGYVPNAAARNLVMQRTGLIVLVFTDPDVVIGTTFFSDLVATIVARLDDEGYRTVLLLPDSRRQRALGDVVRPGAYDGAILIGHRAGDGLIEVFAERGIPVVALGRPIDHESVSYVDLDNVGAAQQATEHLIRAGSTRPALLSCAADRSWGADRMDGFTLATNDAGIGPDLAAVQSCDFTVEGGYDGMKALLSRRGDIDGLLVTSETLLAGAMSALKEAGIRIPQDLLLACFDDGPRLKFASPPVTAVRQPLTVFGSEMVRFVIEAIANPATRMTTCLPAVLEVRASSRR